jgi:Zn-dependent protease
MDLAPKIILSLLGLGIAVIFHEQMHARVAHWLGDPTGKNDNRLSWNPVHHIDPFMTILLPIILLVGSGGRFVFGGAKPVMINPLNFKNPSLGMCLSAAAGPFSNFFLGLVGFILCILLARTFPSAILSEDTLTWNGYFLVNFVRINVILGAFNILPLPGLDGSRILRFVLPRNLQALLDSIEPFAMFITIALVFFGAAQVLGPVILLMAIWFHTLGGEDLGEAVNNLLFGP